MENKEQENLGSMPCEVPREPDYEELKVYYERTQDALKEKQELLDALNTAMRLLQREMSILRQEVEYYKESFYQEKRRNQIHDKS